MMFEQKEKKKLDTLAQGQVCTWCLVCTGYLVCTGCLGLHGLVIAWAHGLDMMILHGLAMAGVLA